MKRKYILILFLFFTPIVFILVKLLNYKFIFRFGLINASRIGNFAAVSELYLTEKKIEKKNIYNKIYIDILSIEKPISNFFFQRLVKRKIKIFPYYFVKSNIFFINFISKFIEFEENNLLKVTSFKDRDVNNTFDKFDSQITLNEEEIEYGYKKLKKINIFKKDKIVCMIVRDSAYLKNTYKNDDWSYHEYRDSDVENYKDA